MKSLSLQKLLPNVLILAIGCLSFVYYSALYFKGYNSDHGIHVLMAQDLELPRDLYYRGQDRLGSLIPMLGHLFVLLGANALVAVSIAQYLLLTSCFLLLRPFFSNTWQRVLLAAAIFLPNWAFLEQVLIGHPYIGHLFFLSSFLYLYFKFPFHNQALKFFLLVLTACLAVWSSELAAVNFLVFAWLYREELLNALKHKRIWWAAGTGALLGLLFLAIAKLSGAHSASFYQFFTNGDQLLTGLKRLLGALYEQAIFAGNKPPARVLFWLIVLLAASFLLKRKNVPKLPQFFLLSATGMLVLVLLSYWPVVNNYPLRYYTPAFLQLLFFFILMSKESLLQKVLLSGVVGLSGYTGLYVVDHFNLEVDDRLNREEMLHFTKLGKLGIIGSYWNTHAIDALSTQVVATPYEGHYNRMYEKIPEQVLAQDTILLIRNGFLESLPDSIVQFGRPLVRIGPVETLNEFEYAYYR